MRKIIAIAKNTFREAIRDKILYAILFFALLMLFTSLLLGELSFGQSIRITKDLGLTSISLFGIAIAIFVGVSLVHKEIDKRTLYTIISKPIHRYHFILGKYLGMLFTVSVQIVILMLVFSALLYTQQEYLELDLYKSIYLYWVEISLIISIALFFSSFTTPFFSGIFTFSIFVIGRLMPDIEMVLQKTKNPLTWWILKLSTALPNLQFFNLGERVVHGEPIPNYALLSPTLYAISYIGVFLLSAMIIFSKREFI